MNKTALISAVADMKIVNNGKLAEVQANDAKLAQIELVELDFESRTALDKQRMELSVRNAEYAKLATANDKLRSEAQLMSGLIAYMSTIISKPDFDDEIADAIYNVLVKHRMIEHRAKYHLLKLYHDENINVFIDGVEASRRKSSRKSRLFSVVGGVETNYTITGDLESEDGTFVIVDDEGVERTIRFEIEHKAKYSLLKLYKSKQYNVYIDGIEARRTEINGKPALEAGDVDDTINFTINGDLESVDGIFNVLSDEGYDITIRFMKGL